MCFKHGVGEFEIYFSMEVIQIYLQLLPNHLPLVYQNYVFRVHNCYSVIISACMCIGDIVEQCSLSVGTCATGDTHLQFEW